MQRNAFNGPLVIVKQTAINSFGLAMTRKEVDFWVKCPTGTKPLWNMQTIVFVYSYRVQTTMQAIPSNWSRAFGTERRAK